MIDQQAEGVGFDFATDEAKSYKFYNSTSELFYDDPSHTYFRHDPSGKRVDIPGVTTVLKAAIDKSFVLIPWATKLCVEHIMAQTLDEQQNFKEFSPEQFLQILNEGKTKHKDALNDAGNIGNIVHDALEQLAKHCIRESDGKLSSNTQDFVPAESQAASCFNAAVEWLLLHNIQFVFAERKIYSRTYDFAGTSDVVAYVDSCDDLTCCRGKKFKRQLSVIDYKSSNQLNDTFRIQAAAYQFAFIEELELPITHRYILRLGKHDGKFEPQMTGPEFFEDDMKTFLDALSLYRSSRRMAERHKVDQAELRSIINAQKAEIKAQQQQEKSLAKQAEKDAKAAIKADRKAEKGAAKANPQPEMTLAEKRRAWAEADVVAEPKPRPYTVVASIHARRSVDPEAEHFKTRVQQRTNSIPSFAGNIWIHTSTASDQWRRA